MIISLATLAVLIMMLALIVFTYDDDDGTSDNETSKISGNSKLVGFITPQYGGIPVYINQKIHAAKEIGDREAEAGYAQARTKLFKNRRSADQQLEIDIAGKKKFIEKYGDAGALAIRHTEALKRLRSLTPEDQAVLIAKQQPKPKTRKKAGGKS